MMYQKLLLGKEPYSISVGGSKPFVAHRHPEVELSYCISGCFEIVINNRKYILEAGDIAVVSPMAAHEFAEPGSLDCKKATIEVGPVFLGEHFDGFTSMDPDGIIYRLKREGSNNDLYNHLATLLDETAGVHASRSDFYELHLKSNIYKISALLLQLLKGEENGNARTKNMRDVEKVDKALEFIYKKYYEPLDIERVSTACGYSKSNFCKIFKSITGDTFHNILNRHRVEIACMHLKEDNISVEKIAQAVGFMDAKSFCRVFKKIKGETSGEYRKRLSKGN